MIGGNFETCIELCDRIGAPNALALWFWDGRRDNDGISVPSDQVVGRTGVGGEEGETGRTSLETFGWDLSWVVVWVVGWRGFDCAGCVDLG